MKIFLSIIAIAFFALNASAQGKIEITGQIKDNQTKNNLEFCNVAVLNTKDSLITAGVTNNKGFFSIPVDPGYYRFVFSFIGFKSDTSKMIVATENKFIGVFKLEQNVNSLKEISVTESSKEAKLDRDVQVVTDKMKAGTSSAKEVLDKVNGVDFDRYNNSIKVDNDSKVIILVDGIQKDQEYIKNLSPDRLKKVEVIRDPGGRYALEGYSAVINIILKKDYQGTEIFLSERAMADPDATKKEYIPVQNTISGTINYVYNKVNIYAKYDNVYSSFNFNSSNNKEYNNGLMIDRGSPIGNPINTKVKSQYNNYTLGADYYINPKHTISFESNLSMQPKNKNTYSDIYHVVYSLNDTVLDTFTSESSNSTNNTNSYNSLFYEGKLDENNVINSNFTYSNYSNNYVNQYKERESFSRNESGKDVKNATKFYIEFTHTFKNKTSWQIGYGNTWEELNSSFLSDTVSNFKYSDTRHKLYTYYSWQIAKKLSVKFGGAGETSAPNSDGYKKTYTIFQPYADIKFDASKNLNLKAKFRASSNYPNISQTNPYTSIIDVQTVRTGNPKLSPEVTNKVSLQATILQGLLTIEPYYHFSNNTITEIGTLRPDSIFEYTYSNAGNYKNYGVQAAVTVPFGKSLFLQSNVDFFNSSIKYAGKTNSINDWSMSSQLIYQNQKHKTMAGLQYQNNMRKFITAQGYNKGDNDFWILFVQQPFFKDKLSVMLLYFTPITWGVDFNQGSYIKTDTYTEGRWYNIDLLKNMVMLEISYRFNKGKSITKKEKEIEQIKEKSNKGIF
jgi:hypothetical protein